MDRKSEGSGGHWGIVEREGLAPSPPPKKSPPPPPAFVPKFVMDPAPVCPGTNTCTSTFFTLPR